MYNGSEAIKSLLNKTKTNGLPILDTPIIVHGNELERNRCTPQEAPLMAFCVRKQILILLLVKFVYQQQLQHKLQFHSKSCIENLVDSIMFFQLVFLYFFYKKYILQMTCLILIGSKSG